ncbi:MAG: RNA 2',3'-cyclic phosphodiesterase [Propionibacteriaceae bacterium]|jgi:2'-5' RNA ligase|nr:RNA 2',3'-cyclic phosphodiesterase [Propionibacteriaceae bacterium]
MLGEFALPSWHHGGMRLFAAVVPPAFALDHLENALALALPRRFGHGNPCLPRQTWHITLAFFGEVSRGHVPALAADLAEAAGRHGPLSLELAGAGTFSGRLGWIGVGGAVRQLKALMSDLAGLWDKADGSESCLPHMTISRQAARGGLGPALTALAVYRGPAWTVDGICLVESRLGQGVGGHPFYETIATAALASQNHQNWP